MSYIYKIVNKLNNKIYIGKTNLSSIEERFKEHCRDYDKFHSEKRPLYLAMKKYGIENFQIHLLEECPPEKASEREQFWIEYYQSYISGYNATIGGDGRQLYDYNLLIKDYLSGLSMTQVAKKYDCTSETVLSALKNNHIQPLSSSEYSKQHFGQPVIGINKITQENYTFDSQHEAANWIITQGYSKSTLKDVVGKISMARRGKRKSAYGFYWNDMI